MSTHVYDALLARLVHPFNFQYCTGLGERVVPRLRELSCGQRTSEGGIHAT